MSAKQNGNGPANEQDEKYDVEVTDDKIIRTPKDATIRDTVEFHAVVDVFEDEPSRARHDPPCKGVYHNFENMPSREEGMRFKGVYHEGGYVIEEPFKTADEAEAWVEAAIRGPRLPQLELRLTWADSTKVGRTYWPALIADDRIVKAAELHNRDAALQWIASVGNEYGVEYQDVPLPPET